MTRPVTQAVSPSFIVSNVELSIAFYRDKLGFETRFRAPDPNPFFAIVGRDVAQLFLKSERDVPPIPNHTRHAHLRLDAFVYVSDPDALAAEFAAHGAAFSSPLQDTHDGLRGFEISDPDGYILFFGRPDSWVPQVSTLRPGKPQSPPPPRSRLCETESAPLAKPALVFDLDETPTDSMPGIVACLRKVLDAPNTDDREIHLSFIVKTLPAS